MSNLLSLDKIVKLAEDQFILHVTGLMPAANASKASELLEIARGINPYMINNKESLEVLWGTIREDHYMTTLTLGVTTRFQIALAIDPESPTMGELATYCQEAFSLFSASESAIDDTIKSRAIRKTSNQSDNLLEHNSWFVFLYILSLSVEIVARISKITDFAGKA